MAKNELKKCPCCNGPAIYNEDLNRFYAECHHCQLRTASYRTKDRAAEIWNTRILEAELKQHEWRDIDTPPEEKKEVWILTSYGKTTSCVYRDGLYYRLMPCRRCDGLTIGSITKWKPIILPEVE